MNRRTFRIFQAHTKGMSEGDKLAVARMIAEQAWVGPFSEKERDLSAALVAAHSPAVWLHGGMAGRNPGDVLLPAGITGSDPRGLGEEIPDRQRHVFITGDLSIAEKYAELSGGCVYVVNPIGVVDVDPMELRALQLFARDKGVSLLSKSTLAALPIQNFCCGSAAVRGVLA